MPGRVCNRHEQYVPEGQDCPYCEPTSVPATRATACKCGAFAFPAGIDGFIAIDGRHTATRCPDSKPMALSSCSGYPVPPKIAEQFKREIDRDEPVIHVHVKPTDADGVQRVVSSPAFREALREARLSAPDLFWRSNANSQPPPTPNQVIEWMQSALRAPPRPPGPVIVSPDMYDAWREQFAPPEPDVLRTVAPSGEERATWAVCEFLRWGATPEPIERWKLEILMYLGVPPSMEAEALAFMERARDLPRIVIRGKLAAHLRGPWPINYGPPWR